MRLRFLTYNLLNDDTFEQRLPLIRDVLRATDADIVAVQELPPAGGFERGLSYLGFPGGASTTFRRPDDGWTETLAVFSRYPVEHAEPIDLRPGVANCVRVRLATPLGAVDVFNLHLHPRESVLRRSEMEFVLLRANAYRAAPVVILGDFNAVASGQTLQPALRAFQSAFARSHGHDPGSTFPTPLRTDLEDVAGAALDHILFRPEEFRVVDAGLAGDALPGGKWPSDHWGVWADLER